MKKILILFISSFFIPQTLFAAEEIVSTAESVSWTSILPPLIAITIALIFHEVLLALFIGIFSGALIAHGFSFSNIFSALFTSFDTYIVNSIADPDHVAVIVFSMLIGGMVAIISRNGGMKGVVIKLSKYADTPLMGQFITWLLGIIIFFDDYANTLVVGNTMRPVTDQLKISREKLSYIVDSTAAPVAALAFITTWIGAELGFVQDAIDVINKDGNVLQESAYSIFLHSIQYSFYPILTLLFILLLIKTGKDFGPMLKAERRARNEGITTAAVNSNDELKKLEPVEGIKYNWLNALIPVLTLIISVVCGLLFSGYDSTIWNDMKLSFTRKISSTIGNADSYKALIWASAAGVIVAMILTSAQKILSIKNTFETLLDGFKTMLPAIAVLILAWALGGVVGDLGTADYLSSVFSDKISPYWIAELTFLMAGIIAFATGTSWGTMTILYPLALPLTWKICLENGLSPDESMQIFYNVVSVVLAGAVFGDHCSPISDTTILSSMATACPHMDHVRTQLPYAITVAVVSMLICTKLADLGFAWYLTYPIGIGILYLIIHFFGRKSETASS